MNRNLLASAMVVFAAGSGAIATCGERFLATWPPVSRTEVRNGDDSGSNGRLWQSRPLVNGGPGAQGTGNPGAEAYGAWGEEDQVVMVQVGQVAVSMNPWHQQTLGGMHTFEMARQQWLSENGYTGGVRTFRRGEAADTTAVAHASAALPQPRATIRIPEGARTKRGFHVDSGRAIEAAARLAALTRDGGEVRISWPMNAPAEARAISDARGGLLVPGVKGVEVAQREP